MENHKEKNSTDSPKDPSIASPEDFSIDGPKEPSIESPKELSIECSDPIMPDALPKSKSAACILARPS